MSTSALLSGNLFSERENYILVVIGIIFLVGGVRGVVTRKGRTRSKGGHVMHYSGKAAVIRGFMGILVGTAIIIFAAVNLV